jgi:CheY-like chemotaxis protein
LIAEDDVMTADRMEDVLVKFGYEVCGIARTVPEAVALGQRHDPDLAVVDLRLDDDGLGSDIVSQLNPRLGVLYVTANVGQLMALAAPGDAYLAKPYTDGDLLRGLQLVENIVATGKASPPFPRGFAMLAPSIGTEHD